MPVSTTGYLFGIFDLFHIAHLDAVRLAAATCDRLIVAVASDDLVERTCGVRPFVPSIERIEILGAIRMIAQVQELNSLDLADEVDRAGADLVIVPAEELDVVQQAVLGDVPEAIWPGLQLLHLSPGRQTASSQVRAALAGTTTRSSVA
jgi:glycerol-3-phosphate cytidylyltransferase